jgi:hypothetical protein
MTLPEMRALAHIVSKKDPEPLARGLGAIALEWSGLTNVINSDFIGLAQA